MAQKRIVVILLFLAIMSSTVLAATTPAQAASAKHKIPVTTVAPVAFFTWEQNTAIIPYIIQFIDTSTNTPTSWLWNFGDGTTSKLQNPSHVYTTFGYKIVSLTVTNAAGSNTTTTSVYASAPFRQAVIVPGTLISKNNVVPLIFLYNTDANVPIQFEGDCALSSPFNGTSVLSYVRCTWNFGDIASDQTVNPNTSGVTTPIHWFQYGGIYKVSLLNSGSGASGGVRRSTACEIVTVRGTDSMATHQSYATVSIIPKLKTNTAPLKVKFDETTHGSWDFGDGSTSNAQNPIHTYKNAGCYKAVFSPKHKPVAANVIMYINVN